MLTDRAADALTRIAEADGTDALVGVIGDYLAGYDLHSFTAALIASPVDEEDEGAKPQIEWLTDAPEDYAEFYFDGGNEARDYGIRVHTEERRDRPFEIGAAFERRLQGLGEAERGFYRAAETWGYRSGLVLPSFAMTPGGVMPCGFSVWSEEGGRRFDAMRAERESEIAMVLFATQARLLPKLVIQAGLSVLSAREAECLSYTACGLRADEVADRLCLATVTVRTHLNAARAKLGAATLPEAVAEGIRHGLIAP